MNKSAKRVISVLLVALLCLSLLSGLSFAAQVDYQTGNPEGFENVILNWGHRGTDATFLSPNAVSFYSENNVTYSQLADLQGSADVGSVPNSALYERLQSLMVGNHSYITSYADTRHLYSYTDCQDGIRNKLTCFYSGISIGPDWDSGATWNREHTWPDSKGMEGSDEDDIMMLRPASSSVNSSRGNNAYGESEGFFNPNSPSNGAHDIRGDVARIFLYIYVRWGNTAAPWGEDGVIENKDVLLKWMEADPVDTWEMGRNDSVESITGTRNVFIDYPELAFALFEEELPAMTTPSGEAMKSALLYTITPLTNNSTWGTVSLSGKTINASPATGYQVSGYTLISGDATVTRVGNAFTVNANSNCIVQINFEARTPCDILFMENGVEASDLSVYTGDSITMPQHSGEMPEGYTFQGWITSELTETATKPAGILAAGKTATAEADVTYYALYSRLDASGTGSSTAYELYSGEVTPGNYLVTYDNGALAASVSDKGRLNFEIVTPVGNTVDDPSSAIIWELSITDDGYVTLFNKETSSYAAGTGVKNKAKLLTAVDSFAKWEVSGEAPYEFVNLGNKNKGVNEYLRRNSDFGYACYATSTGGALTLYKQAGGTVYYCTTAAACDHANTEDVAAQAPTCTADGWTAGVYCNDCASYISGYEALPASGHSYETVVTPPTVTEQGYTVYTCSVCSDTYVDDYVDALGETFTVSFAVPQGVAPIADQLCNNTGITLPTAGLPSGDAEYSFLGWTTEPVEDTDTAPTILTGNYRATENITLYAVYSYITGATDSVGWNLVTDVADLATGDRVILGCAATSMVPGEIYSQYLTNVEAVFNEDGTAITELPENALIWTLINNGDQTWTITDTQGRQLCATALKKVAWDRGTNTWTIEIDEAANATVYSTNTSYGRFLYNVNSPRFTTYTSNPTVSMLMPQLYKLEGSLGTVMFTTLTADKPEGVSVSGQITSFGEASEAVTVELWSNGAAVATLTATDGSYSFEKVAAGEYTLKFSKLNHVTREYAVTVAAEAVVQDATICLIGDVTGDGEIDIADTGKIYAHVKGTSELTGYALACGDVMADGEINIADTGTVYAHVKGTKMLF